VGSAAEQKTGWRVASNGGRANDVRQCRAAARAACRPGGR